MAFWHPYELALLAEALRGRGEPLLTDPEAAALMALQPRIDDCRTALRALGPLRIEGGVLVVRPAVLPEGDERRAKIKQLVDDLQQAQEEASKRFQPALRRIAAAVSRVIADASLKAPGCPQRELGRALEEPLRTTLRLLRIVEADKGQLYLDPIVLLRGVGAIEGGAH